MATNGVATVHDELAYTVDEALDCIGFGKFQVIMVVFAGFAWFSDAMEVMLLSFLGPSVRPALQPTMAWVTPLV